MTMGDRRKFKIALICSLLIFSSLASVFLANSGIGAGEDMPTRSTTLYVGAGQTYMSIQEAVNNASSGDTIRVFDGNYSEYIAINKSISLRGNGTAKSNIIKDNNLPTSVYINKSGVEITGFSFLKKDDSSEHEWISAYYASNLHIWECEFFNSNISINISSSEMCKINDTEIIGTLDGAGIMIDAHSRHRIYDNTITNCTYGVWFTGSTQMNSIMRNTLYKNTCGIEFSYDGDENRIENNTVSNNTYSITLNSHCDKNLIANNIILNNSDGIIVRRLSNNNTVRWNSIKGQSSYGITVDGIYRNVWCNDNVIRDNEIKENGGGLSIDYTNRNTIERCVIEDNYWGIRGTYGINIKIHNSTVRGSNLGINLDHSFYGSVKYNLFEDNENEAIYLNAGYQGSYLFRIYNNSFVNNNGANSTFNSSHIQVFSSYEVSRENSWDDGIGHGNYWSDWTTPDNDSDGVVDLPYPILSTFVSDDYPLTESPFETNYPPVIDTVNERSAYSGFYYRVQYLAIDQDTPREELVWSMETNATWLSCSSSGLLQGTPISTHIGTYWVNISVTDGNNSDFTNFTLEVYSTNSAPVITTTDVTTCFEDQLYSVDYDADDVDVLNWALVTNATFLYIDRYTGVLSGTPRNRDVGTHRVQIIVTDTPLLNDSVTFNLTVLNVNDPPLIVEDPSVYVYYDRDIYQTIHRKIDVYCTEDSSAYLNFSAYDQDPSYDILNWTIVSGPSFLRMTTSQVRHDTGVLGAMNLTGTPSNNDVGLHNVTIRVSDGNGGQDTTTFNLTVNNTNDAPSIITSDQTNGYRNQYYRLDYNATDIDPTNDTLTWSLSTNAPFLSMNSSTGVLSGTPNSTQTGMFWVNVSVGDGNGGSDHSNFTLTIRHNNSAPASTGTPQPLSFDEDSSDDSIDIDSLFEDEDGDPLSYEVEFGQNLSVTVTDDNKLIIEPRPDWAGMEVIRIFAYDGEYTASVILTVVIENVNDEPSIMNISFDPDMKEGEDLLFKANAEDPDLRYGDVLTFEWYIDGIGLVGTGEELLIDLDAGEYLLTLVVTDSDGTRVERQLTFEVEKEPEETSWVPLLIFIVALLIMMMFAVGVFFFRKRKEEEGSFDAVDLESRKASGQRGPLEDHIDMQSEPMLDQDIGFEGSISGGGLDMEGAPELEDLISIMEEMSFLESVEMNEDPLILSAYDEIISREEARDISHIQELRTTLRKRIIEEEGDEAIYYELNEILEAVEE